MKKTLRILPQKPKKDVIKQPHCFIGSRNIQEVTVDEIYFRSYDILINAGGLDVKGMNIMLGDLSSISSATPILGGGRNIPKIGEERYSDKNPGIDDF